MADAPKNLRVRSGLPTGSKPVIPGWRTTLAAMLPCILLIRTAGAAWVEQSPILQASDEADMARFGWSVGIEGDVVVVGAPTHPSDSDAGQAYIFRQNGATWVEEQILEASDQSADAWFGRACAIAGPVVLVGAHLHPSGGDSRGQAYVFRYDGSAWIEEQILEASDEFDKSSFGFSLAIEGNVAIVGAPDHSIGSNFFGQAYVFRHDGSAWIEEKVITPADIPNSSSFGYSVAIEGGRLLISDTKYDYPGTGRGQV